MLSCSLHEETKRRLHGYKPRAKRPAADAGFSEMLFV